MFIIYLLPKRRLPIDGWETKARGGKSQRKDASFFFFLFHSRFVLVDVLEGGIEH